jgi:hypothetical protein
VTLHYRPVVPPALRAFVATCTNRDEILREYGNDPARWAAAVRARLPLGAWYAFLLTPAQLRWMTQQRDALLSRLKSCIGPQQWDETSRWEAELLECPLPLRLLRNFVDLLSDAEWGANLLHLPTGPSDGDYANA